jgi:hypothetical protein
VLAVLASVAVAPKMADPQYVGPVDTQLLLLPAGTYTSSPTNGSTVNLGSGFSPGGGGVPMLAQVPVTLTSPTNSGNTYTFKLQDSADNNTFVDRSPAVAPSGSNSQILDVGAFIHSPYVKLVGVVSGTASPSITIKDVYLQPKGGLPRG